MIKTKQKNVTNKAKKKNKSEKVFIIFTYKFKKYKFRKFLFSCCCSLGRSVGVDNKRVDHDINLNNNINLDLI